jgi:tetratricopeptide repeat protein
MVDWRRLRFVVAGAAALFSAHDAAAQGRRSHAVAPPPPPTVTQSTSSGDVAEQRFKAGDCAGALDAFDAALRTAIDPELHRDRGTCHEKLGHPFPAIEDYRFYLTRRPDAADADTIRARVAALESQVGIVKAGEADVSRKNGAEVSTSIGGETDLPGEGKGGLEAAEANEELDVQADSSPLRRGRGFIIGVAIGGRYFASSALGGAELGGFDVRYSFASSSTILLEVSIGYVNASGPTTSLSGPGIMGGYELRIPISARVSDALLLGLTFRYESLSESGGLDFSILEPEGRFGYRHVFGPAFGLEAILDGGAAFASANGVANSSTTQALIGGHIAAVLGF